MSLRRSLGRHLVWRKHKKLVLCLIILAAILAMRLFRREKPNIPVIIVEEHHEVLPYWIQAAEDELIPFSSNTLVHIDAHSDDALPEYIPLMPLFRWPRSEDEIDALIQKNDVFIMEAVMIGLVDRFIWITPAWNDETKSVEHHVEDVELGWATLRAAPDSDAEIEPYLCRCEMSDNGVKNCFYFNYSIEPSPGKRQEPQVSLHNSLCTNTRVYTFEILTTKTAMGVLEDNQGWIVKEESIILNIDEDYFGVELPGTVLTSAGISWPSVELIDEKLTAIFCPRHIAHEALGQEIMEDILEHYNKLCEFGTSGSKHCKLTPQTLADGISKDILLAWWKRSPGIFCFQNDLELRQATRALINVTYALTASQIAAMSRLGFCLNTSPRTYAFAFNGHLALCHGTNNPEDPYVQPYRSGAVALQRDVIHVQALLQGLPAPRVVTMCRSSRDGYTPRDQVILIELPLVRHFMRQNLDKSNRLPYHVVYDDYIMATKI